MHAEKNKTPITVNPAPGFGQVTRNLKDDMQLYQEHRSMTVCQVFGSAREAARVCRDLALAYGAFADEYERQAKYEQAPSTIPMELAEVSE